MLLTNHVLSGALIGTLARRPVPAFALGVVSHFALDAVPHWGGWRDDRHFLRVAVTDGLTALGVLAACAGAAPRGRRTAVLAGMLGAALPDADKPTGIWFGFSPWPPVIARFHGRIQDEAPGRFGREAASGLVFAAATAMLSGPARHGHAARPAVPPAPAQRPVSRPSAA